MTKNLDLTNLELRRHSFHVGENKLGTKFGEIPKFDQGVMELFSSFVEDVYRMSFYG